METTNPLPFDGPNSAAMNPVAAEADPLSPEQRATLREGERRSRQVLRACKIATFNAWTLAIAAALTAPSAVFSVGGAVVTAALVATCWNEFRGRKLLRRFEVAGARTLGWNQVILLALVLVYCGWKSYEAAYGPPPMASVVEAGLDPSLVSDVEHIARTLTVAVFVTVAFLSVIIQGLNAWYYFSRGSVVERYRRDTPGWILDLQRDRLGSETPDRAAA
ncbi:MAG: hypothetical protein ACF8PN_05215 [Phycisphaerales bacterium]